MNDQLTNLENHAESLAETPTAIARPVAPEDVRPGDYLTVLFELGTPGFFERMVGEARPVFEVPDNAAMPARVLEICLPLLLLQTAPDRCILVDVRRFRLARVPAGFGERVQAAFEAARRAAEEREKAAERTIDTPAPEPDGSAG